MIQQVQMSVLRVACETTKNRNACGLPSRLALLRYCCCCRWSLGAIRDTVVTRESKSCSCTRRCISYSVSSSPSRSARPVSKNHMCFLMKCTTMVPPNRLSLYRFLRPSRCCHASSADHTLPEIPASIINKGMAEQQMLELRTLV
jgi:hypothetical protein